MVIREARTGLPRKRNAKMGADDSLRSLNSGGKRGGGERRWEDHR